MAILDKHGPMEKNKSLSRPQVKICGLTDAVEARACAQLGADAIGLVFFPPSPRNLPLNQAIEITAVLPPHVTAVGVFVNPAWDTLAETISGCGLGAVQLHGNETPEFVARVAGEFNVKVIKALFAAKQPGFNSAADYRADVFLLECGRGKLPGGNAETWDWSAGRIFADNYPTLLAGGLCPENIAIAVNACLPDGVDISSGLEWKPGRKDLKKVEDFMKKMETVASIYTSSDRMLRPIF